MKKQNPVYRSAVTAYLSGLVMAVALSVTAYLVAVYGNFETSMSMIVILILAAVQIVVQLVLFLHIGRQKGSAERGAIFGYVMIMALIIVIGSIWVMKNLDYRMGMDSNSMQNYMLEQNKKGF